jgi:nucleoid DNA-binding protein
MLFCATLQVEVMVPILISKQHQLLLKWMSKMNKFEFVEYTAKRYGIDESLAETMVDMFADTLQELIAAGQSVNIDEIGEFKTIPMFPNGLNHNNIALTKLSKRHMFSFKASQQLISSLT